MWNNHFGGRPGIEPEYQCTLGTTPQDTNQHGPYMALGQEGVKGKRIEESKDKASSLRAEG